MKPHQFSLHAQVHRIEYKQRNGLTRFCSYCGSVHPADLAAAIQTAGATLSPSDQKYGWPHKFYVEGAPGMIKFYSEHLLDATDAEREVIGAASGLRIEFGTDNQGSVKWSRYEAKSAMETPPGDAVPDAKPETPEGV